MDSKIFDELVFAIRRGKFSAAEQMIAGFKRQYAPGSEEYGEMCYYELLTHYRATSISELKYKFVCNSTNPSNCDFCNAVEEYSNITRQVLLTSIFRDADRFQNFSDYLQSTVCSAEKSLKEKAYGFAIESFLEANEKRRAAETAIIAAKAELKKNNHAEALRYLDYALFDDECYEEYKKINKHEQLHQRFQQEIGSPKKYAEEVLKKADIKKYHEYIRLVNTRSGYTDGALHFIAALIATVTSVFMLFDPHLDIPALYVIWGICASIALHKKFLWDFGFIKSIGGTFLLCLIPVLLAVFADEVLDMNGLGAIITIAVTLIEFIPTLIRDIKYIKNANAGKKAVMLRTQFIEPTLGQARRELVEKYAPLTDRATATAWANTIKF